MILKEVMLPRESSFNMTRGWGGGMKILRVGSEKIRGASKNLYSLNPKGGVAPEKLNR